MTLYDEIAKAIRDARNTPDGIYRRELIERATLLIEDAVDTNIVCAAGHYLDEGTGLCEECLEQQAQLTAARHHAGVVALERIDGIPF